MIKLSLCMIVKNEEEVIGRCLKSVHEVVDEIIIVDTGSTDRTKEICSEYTEKIYDFEWINDFAAARNFAFSLATMDYLFWLDADDVLQTEDSEKIRELKETLDPTIDSITMVYCLAQDEQGNMTSSNRRNRIVKRLNHFQWRGFVHEYLEVGGKISNSDIVVYHKPMKSHVSDRNLTIYNSRLERGDHFSPRDLYYFANECLDHRLYEQAVEYYEKFLDTNQGWIEDKIAACGKLADCFHHLGNKERESYYTLKSFEYDTPRAEFCCRMGFGFMQQNEWEKAVFWYRLASEMTRPNDNWGFFNHACWTWLPHLQLCVCYYRLGEYLQAYKHNEIARQYIPDNEKVLFNRRLLEGLLN
ncbi:glycosyltransferase [Cohnella endophytica]|nr:glycosyltransferase [Cohnella endophytica]